MGKQEVSFEGLFRGVSAVCRYPAFVGSGFRHVAAAEPRLSSAFHMIDRSHHGARRRDAVVAGDVEHHSFGGIVECLGCHLEFFRGAAANHHGGAGLAGQLRGGETDARTAADNEDFLALQADYPSSPLDLSLLGPIKYAIGPLRPAQVLCSADTG